MSCTSNLARGKGLPSVEAMPSSDLAEPSVRVAITQWLTGTVRVGCACPSLGSGAKREMVVRLDAHCP